MHQPDEYQIITYQQAAAFAASHIATRPDLQAGTEFPRDIWQKMGEAGLFKIGIAKKYGGTGGGYLDLLKAGEAFVRSGSSSRSSLIMLSVRSAHHSSGGNTWARQPKERSFFLLPSPNRAAALLLKH
jgi:alkylation response protein AidB-like acyl-CoA dehydrogenase